MFGRDQTPPYDSIYDRYVYGGPSQCTRCEEPIDIDDENESGLCNSCDFIYEEREFFEHMTEHFGAETAKAYPGKVIKPQLIDQQLRECILDCEHRDKHQRFFELVKKL